MLTKKTPGCRRHRKERGVSMGLGEADGCKGWALCERAILLDRERERGCSGARWGGIRLPQMRQAPLRRQFDARWRPGAGDPARGCCRDAFGRRLHHRPRPGGCASGAGADVTTGSSCRAGNPRSGAASPARAGRAWPNRGASFCRRAGADHSPRGVASSARFRGSAYTDRYAYADADAGADRRRASARLRAGAETDCDACAGAGRIPARAGGANACHPGAAGHGIPSPAAGGAGGGGRAAASTARARARAAPAASQGRRGTTASNASDAAGAAQAGIGATGSAGGRQALRDGAGDAADPAKHTAADSPDSASRHPARAAAATTAGGIVNACTAAGPCPAGTARRGPSVPCRSGLRRLAEISAGL